MSGWDSVNPWQMAEYVRASGMPLTEDEERLVRRALEGGHAWSVYKLHELNVLCFEARGYARFEYSTSGHSGVRTPLEVE